ncbi:carboxymuconolactone decarboxylase family protein [Pyruvatibacter mobilis]|uniref:carboxymuconolactone decarboxylase family protein n=1 Tax=Pyruvatibacter mobilis TaxID=1712261 RepID=UPI003C7CB702
MPRIPYPQTTEITPENAALLADLPDLNVFRMMARAGAAFGPFMALVNSYLNNGTLDPQLRELVILRVGHTAGAAYEIWHHERVSRELGMSDDRIAAAAGTLPSELFTETENAALALTDDILAHTRAGDASFNAAHALLGDNQTTELVVIVGVYQMVCSFLETMDIEIEDGPVPAGRLEKIAAGVTHHRGQE